MSDKKWVKCPTIDCVNYMEQGAECCDVCKNANKIICNFRTSKQYHAKNHVHKWTISDEWAALDAFLTGISQHEASAIGEARGMGANSFWLKIQNFKYLATNGANGAHGYSRQCEQVWEQYCHVGRVIQS